MKLEMHFLESLGIFWSAVFSKTVEPQTNTV